MLTKSLNSYSHCHHWFTVRKISNKRKFNSQSYKPDFQGRGKWGKSPLVWWLLFPVFLYSFFWWAYSGAGTLDWSQIKSVWYLLNVAKTEQPEGFGSIQRPRWRRFSLGQDLWGHSCAPPHPPPGLHTKIRQLGALPGFTRAHITWKSLGLGSNGTCFQRLARTEQDNFSL